MKTLAFIASLASLTLAFGCARSAAPAASGTPVVLFTTPSDGATAVTGAATLQVAFNQPVDCGTVTAASFIVVAGDVPVVGLVSCQGAVAEFAPTRALPLATTVTATLTTDILAASGEPLADLHSWTFATEAYPNVAPPLVSFTQPAAGATGVDPKVPVQIAFDEPVDCGTVDSATFVVMDGSKRVPGAVTCDGANATFTPAHPLLADTSFTATLTTGVADSAGDPMAADYTWSFTTVAPTGDAVPDVTLTVPSQFAVDVDVTTKVKIAFDQVMDCSTLDAADFTVADPRGPVTGRVACLGTTAIFTPDAPLASGEKYTATVTTAVKDQAGNPLAKTIEWTFTTLSTAVDIVGNGGNGGNA
jgi:hypothetical protein